MIPVLDKENLFVPDPDSGAFVLIDKDVGWTSFDVVAKLRNALRKALGRKKVKVGHAGTLDPAASGLLILAVGRRATREISALQNSPKEYLGTVQLGATTPSYDSETAVNQRFETKHIKQDLIDSVLPSFVGEIMQKPPVYSALKKGGQRLYRLARQGREVQPDARPVHIFDIRARLEEDQEVKLYVCCGKGTYIRSLAFDLGKALGSGGYLSRLRRTSIGEYRVEDALKIEELVGYLLEESRKEA